MILDFVDKFSPTDLVSACIAFLAIVVSFRAYSIAREKLRLDLYNKRFDIYSKVVKYALVFAHSKYPELKNTEYLGLQENFILAFRESQFLFKKQDAVYEIISDINRVTGSVRHYYDYKDKEDNRPDAHEKNITNKASLEPKIKDLEEAMCSYLRFDYLSYGFLSATFRWFKERFCCLICRRQRHLR